MACADDGLNVVSLGQPVVRFHNILCCRGKEVRKNGVNQQQRHRNEKTEGHEHGSTKVGEVGLIDVCKMAQCFTSMPEQTMPCKQHGEATSVGLVDDLLVANGPSGLNNRRGSGLGGLFQTVLEGEESVRGQHASVGPLARTPSGNANGFDATGLTGPNANGGRALNHHDGV